MLKKLFIFAVTVFLFCGCSTTLIQDVQKADVLTEKHKKNAEKMTQIIGNKQNVTLLLSVSELHSAMNDPEKFADEIKMLGFSGVGIPIVSAASADLVQSEGKALYDFVMLLYSKSLRTVYLLNENIYINHHRGSEFVFGNENPYHDILLTLKKFWQNLPESAEMPTVVVEIGMNRWNGSNPDRPAALVHVWRQQNYGRGKANELMFEKSMKNFTDCRKYLDLEQLILVADEEVVLAGEKGLLTNANTAALLQKADALGINFADISADNSSKFGFLSKSKEQRAVFAVLAPHGGKNFSDWLADFMKINEFVRKNSVCAGVWVRDWKKLKTVWRNEK